MDVQFWIYVIIGVIYFLSRVLKKPGQQPGESPDTQHPAERRGTDYPREGSAGKPRQLTFEELLREITEAKQPRQREPEPPRKLEDGPVPEFRSYEEEQVAGEARSLEDTAFDEAENARVFQAYENAKRQVSERRSLEETLRLEDTEVKFGKFEAFEERKRKSERDDYLNILRNPVTLKQAVVMSEILKRKF